MQSLFRSLSHILIEHPVSFSFSSCVVFATKRVLARTHRATHTWHKRCSSVEKKKVYLTWGQAAMTVATTPDFKSPGVTSYVAHLIKFIKIVNGRQVTHNFHGCVRAHRWKKVITIIFCQSLWSFKTTNLTTVSHSQFNKIKLFYLICHLWQS